MAMTFAGQNWDSLEGTVRFFLLSGRGFGGSQDATADLGTWVQSTCSVVPASTWQGRSSGGLQLFDCASAVV
jgi:hypothetical protein